MNESKSRGYCSDSVEVKEMPGKGLGLVCVNEIKKDEVIVVFQGWILRRKDLLNGKEEYLRDAIQINDDFFVGCVSDEDIEKADYFNHSCNPNAGFSGDVTIVAMRDIAVGEEVNFDYAMCDNLEELAMECQCGFDGCRKVISGKDWNILELQKKYQGYFSHYIQGKIDQRGKN